MIELVEYFLHAAIPAGNGVGALTFSGGLRGLLIDAAAAAGVTLPPLADETKRRLAAILGVGTIIGNPLDAGFAALSSQENYIQAIRAMLDDPGIDVLLLQEEIPREPGSPKESNLARISAMVGAGEFTKPIAYCSMISYHFTGYSREVRGRLTNTPFLQEPAKTMRAMRSVFAYAAAGAAAARAGNDVPPLPESEITRQIRASAKNGDSTTLDEVTSKAFLAAGGIAVPRELLVSSREAAVDAARSLGFPVVMKVVSAEIAHKSEAGGVRLNLRSPEDVRHAHDGILAGVKAFKPGVHIAGLLVAPQMSGGLELALGIVRDPDVGCVVMVGSGGVLLELMKDTAFGPPGIDAEAAGEMIDRTQAGKMLAGYRGTKPCDRAAVIDALVALGRIARDFGDVIEAVDINPLVVLEKGRGAYALDGLVVLRRPQG
jgi:acetyltransferase